MVFVQAAGIWNSCLSTRICEHVAHIHVVLVLWLADVWLRNFCVFPVLLGPLCIHHLLLQFWFGIPSITVQTFDHPPRTCQLVVLLQRAER